MSWREDPKKQHLVKTDFFGRKTYCDPKTGKPLKQQPSKQEAQKLPKAGWF